MGEGNSDYCQPGNVRRPVITERGLLKHLGEEIMLYDGDPSQKGRLFLENFVPYFESGKGIQALVTGSKVGVFYQKGGFRIYDVSLRKAA